MIMKASGLFLVFMLAASVVVSAQTRTVTNNDLKKYKTERERAERELREDYQRLGLPSPEERAKLNEKEAKEMSELAARLRNSRIAQENARRAAEEVTISAQPPVQAIVVVESGQPVYYYPWQGGWYRYPGSYMGGRRLPQQNGYFAGGQFWPTGPITRPRPARLFGRPR
jgi:DNA gyrase/topoisomerase IV subunit A